MHIGHLIRQKSYEKIEYVLHRHPITFVPILFLFLVLLSVPVFVYFMIAYLYPVLFTGDMIFPLAVLLACTYYLGIYLFFYAQFIDYYLDIWVVTNDRIVDIEQLGLFSRTISEVDLFRIQDVTTDVHGFFATIFHYGNVSIKTASANINIVFRNVSHPNKIRESLIHLSHEDRKYHYTSLATTP
jgi:membrane protein YdbS with pleckstrin-like domain